MRVLIVNREQRDGRIVRILECGHDQVEPPGGRGSAQSPADSRYAFCRLCNIETARAQQKLREPEAKPVDTRSELQRLADDVERLFSFPAGRAWGRDVVAVKKLIEGARRHACPVEPSQS